MFYNSVREDQTIIMSEGAVRPARGRIHLTSTACEGTPYAGLQPCPRLSRSRGVPIRPGLCARSVSEIDFIFGTDVAGDFSEKGRCSFLTEGGRVVGWAA